MKRITIYLFVLSALALFCKGSSAADWQAASCQAVLQNQRIEARFQAGLLYHLTDRATGNVLLSLDPKQLPADYPLFGSTHVALNSCRVLQQINDNEVESRFEFKDGAKWTMHWAFDANGDLVLRSSAHASVPVDELRVLIPGGDLKEHTLVWIHAYGVGQAANAPWNETFVGNPETDGERWCFKEL